MSRPPKPTYQTTHWHAYNQALRQRGSLTVWFDPLMQWEAAPSGRRGRQHAYSDAAIQACLIIKVLFGLPLRHATCFVASLLELSGLGWPVPDLSKRRVWRKIHLGIEEETLEIRAVEVTSSHVGDAPMLPDLHAQIPEDEEIATVTADGAYDTRACHDAIAAHIAAAVIPPRRNARPWKPDTAGARARNESRGPRNTLAGRSGGTGAGITAAAGRRRK